MIQSLKFRLRRTILLTLRGVVYVLLILSLFQAITGTGDLFEQFVLVSILLVLSSYLAVDLQYIRRKWIRIFCGTAMIITTYWAVTKAFLSGVNQHRGSLAVTAPAGVMILLHLGLLMLFTHKINILRNRRKVDGLSFLTPGVALFAFCIAGMFALLTSAKMTVQKVDCNDFYKAVTDVVRFFGSPVLLGVDATKRAEKRIEDVRSQSVGELVGIDSLDNTDLPQLPAGRQGETKQTLQQIIATMEQQNSNNSDGVEQAGDDSGLLDLLQTYRTRFISELVSDKDMINKGLCTIVVDEIENKLQKPGFRFSIAILLFFIFSPIINFLFRIVIAIGFLIFQLLKFFGVWHTEKVLVEMEVIR